MRRHQLIFLAVLAFALLSACQAPANRSPHSVEPLSQPDTRLDWWREARFGLFLHWGLYSVPAGEWNGQSDYGEWIMSAAQIPISTYENFVPQFNPTEFNADAWVLAAKSAGMKYIVITTKHHDGFALFDSAVSEYDIMATPFKRDIMKELADACARHGLKIGWYHSIMDWHHPDYLPRRAWEQRSAESANYGRYVDYLFAQVTELLNNYGPIGVMWFDGEWESSWNHEYGQRLYDLCRKLQPNVIVNNRVDKGRGGMAGMNTGPGFAGDFGTPEQEIPATGMAGVDWESCMTMNRHWGYNKNDDSGYKSSADLIRKLCDIASKGGNFLLNIGPTAEGRLPQLSLKRLQEIGSWMDRNAEAIHGTSASPFAHLPWGRCTVKKQGEVTQLYLHVFDWPENGQLIVPGIGNQVVQAQLLAAPQHSIVSNSAQGRVVLSNLPADAPDSPVSILKLTVAGEPIIFQAPEISAVANEFVKSVQVRLATGSRDLVIRYTLDGTQPSASSPRYTRPLVLTQSATIQARCFYEGKAVSEVVVRKFEKVVPRAGVNIFHQRAGLQVQVYEGKWDRLPTFQQLTAKETTTAQKIHLPAEQNLEFEARVFQGFLEVPNDALYLFELSSDDGSKLFIHAELIVQNDGLHGTTTKYGTMALAKGLHPIRVEWFNKTGDATLELRMAPNGEKPTLIPSDWLVH